MVRPFTAKQIELLTTFADQAAIAIENVRLFEAEQQRTRELTESLEQQTATSEVLQVISSSPGDLKPVFATMLDNAVRICDATFGGVYRFDGDMVRLVATHNLPPAFAEVARVAPFRPSPKSFIGRIAASKTLVHLEDAAASQPYVERDPATVAAVERGGTRAFLAVPMLKENALIGLLYLCRQQVRPYTDKQIELVQGFANQAVIAIENTRLLNELRESLEQQKASADILSVISNSVTDTQPVFDKILVISMRGRLAGLEFTWLP
jgi:GAF domain-containing protein